MNRPDHAQLLDCKTRIQSAVYDLGQELLILRQTGLKISKKPDGSIVTNADMYADGILQKFLSNLTPGIPVVSEESFDATKKFQSHNIYWCADPVDSTSNYSDGGVDFSILISLICHQRPIFGAMYFPARQLFYTGMPGIGAWKMDHTKPEVAIACTDFIKTSPAKLVVSSRGHAKPERLSHIIPAENIGSVKRIDGAIKFAHIAEGQADLYPRFTNLREWDLAAGDAIVSAAGGHVTDINGNTISYGMRADYACPHFFAFGKTP